jgi:hypothetical protein
LVWEIDQELQELYFARLELIPSLDEKLYVVIPGFNSWLVNILLDKHHSNQKEPGIVPRFFLVCQLVGV